MKWLRRWADKSLREENRRLQRNSDLRAQIARNLAAKLVQVRIERDALRARLGEVPDGRQANRR